MSRSYFTVFVVVSLLLVIGCDEDTITSINTNEGEFNGRVFGTLHGIITTADTNTPMDSVRIIYAIEGNTIVTYSDSNGYYRCDNLHESTYTITFYSPDSNYADWFEVVLIDYDEAALGPTEEDFEIVISKNVEMFPFSSTVQGYVYAEMGAESVIAANNVEIKTVGFDGIINSDYSTKTDTSGYFQLSNLPSIDVVSVVVMPWIRDGVEFSMESIDAALEPGGITRLGNIHITPATAEVVVINNNFGGGRFDVDDQLELLCNKALDPSSINVSLMREDTNIPVEIELSGDGLNLSIKPSMTLRTDTEYTLQLSARSLDFGDLELEIPFTTQKGIELISSNIFTAEWMGIDNIELDQQITLEFSLPIDIENTNSDVRILWGPDLIDVPLIWNHSPDRKTITISTNTLLNPGSTYELQYKIFSEIPGDFIWNAGNHLTFLTRPGMTLISASVLDIQGESRSDVDPWETISLIFNREIDQSNQNNVVRISYLDGTSISALLTFTEDENIATVSPQEALQPATDHFIYYEIYSDQPNDFASSQDLIMFTTTPGIQLLNSNIFTADGNVRDDIEQDEFLIFNFSRPIDVLHNENEVTITRAGNEILANQIFSEDSLSLSIRPVGAFRAGSDYSLTMNIHSTIPNDSYDLTADPLLFSTISDLQVPDRITGLLLDTERFGPIDWRSRDLYLKWNAQMNVSHYEVFGYDSYSVLDRILITTIVPDALFGKQAAEVRLPLEFDWLLGDEFATPFTNGIEVRVFVRAVNEQGVGEFSNELILEDVTSPEISLSQTLFGADNSDNNAPTTVMFRFSEQIEYCDTERSPAWNFLEAGGDPAYALDRNDAIWTWDNDYRNGTLSINVPEFTDASDDLLWVLNVFDASGNVQRDTAWIQVR